MLPDIGVVKEREERKRKETKDKGNGVAQEQEPTNIAIDASINGDLMSGKPQTPFPF